MAASTSVTSPLHRKMSARRAKTSGWAAVDLNEKRKQQGLEPEPEREPFPYLSVPSSSSSGPSQSSVNNGGAMVDKPFSSLLLPSVSFPSLMGDKGSDANHIQVRDSHLDQIDGFIKERGFLEVCQKLKELHPWADDALIADVMSGVNDFDKALMLLEAMVSPHHTYVVHDNRKTKGIGADKSVTPKEADIPCMQRFKEGHTVSNGMKSTNGDSLMNNSKFPPNKGVSLTDSIAHDNRKTKGAGAYKSVTPKEAGIPCMQSFEGHTVTNGMKSSNEDSLMNNCKFPHKGVSLTDSVILDELSHALVKCLQSNNEELINNCVSYEKKLHFDGAVEGMRFIPVEPEWEEDDIYSIHRKDALKMTRSAARHSKAASDAYLRGDHLSAQHFSLKAQEEWIAANRLNAQAAKEILSVRNCNNDQWTLDLHGLHATEAVQALQEHLQKIESQVTQNRDARMDHINLKPSFGAAAAVESSGHIAVESESKGSQLNKQRPALLQVITGKGIHSRGQAALPMAVRSFLIENGYRYEDTRPGVITVRPKFRPL